MSWFKRGPDRVAEEIVDDIALLASEPGWSKETQSILDMLLFNAGTVCYREATASMGTDASVAYVKAKTDAMVERWNRERRNRP